MASQRLFPILTRQSHIKSTWWFRCDGWRMLHPQVALSVFVRRRCVCAVNTDDIVSLRSQSTPQSEHLPSSDEVNERAFWLHFKRQQSHLDNGEKVKERMRGKKKERNKSSEWHRPFTALTYHSYYESCLWNIWQLLMTHTHTTGLTVPELTYFFFLPFFLGFKTLTARQESRGCFWVKYMWAVC